MKKIIALILIAVMALTLAACGTKGTEPAETVAVADATELLTKVWSTYAADEMFPAAGGDLNNTVMDGPSKYALDAEEGLDYMLAVPESAMSMIDDAASLVHMMNQNTFTGGAFHTIDGNQQAFADALKENLSVRHWLCGQPDLFKIYAVGDEYVVSVFGASDLIATFDAKLTAQYGDAVAVLYEESLI